MEENVEQPILLFVDTDEKGNIINSIAGESIVPNVNYGFLFEVKTWDIPINIDKYLIQEGKLVKKTEMIQDGSNSEVPQ
ncbi:hypothetical protein EXW38_18745 [Bacillus mycoides]|uniref:Uncharacterized protein n=1 Tax=Bacillus cereus (strain VD146) TaxID=1053236 RepID=R8MQX9_BACCX|nr:MULTISPECIES: hypothetical protein [Bacillus cereus group]EOP36178.1 hypothetical protein IK1_02925 [Bacillus cereus VD146]QWH13262.1 hypothetical protein EXW38_18745 [Bacillus mycoides]